MAALRLRADDALEPTENLLQVVVQGILAGALAIYLFTRSVVLLGAGRAAVFPSLVPGFTLLIGFLALGEVPSWAQLVGFAIVLARLPAGAETASGPMLRLRPGIFAGGLREQRLDDLELRDVDGARPCAGTSRRRATASRCRNRA